MIRFAFLYVCVHEHFLFPISKEKVIIHLKKKKKEDRKKNEKIRKKSFVCRYAEIDIIGLAD